ncbi:MAG: hypothetical protein ACJAQT_002437 [Akkermansiaceae bacterium]|jgi:hypothetical protein
MKPTKLLALTLTLVLASCSDKKETSENPSQGDSGSLASLVLTAAPDNPIDIADLRKSGKPGATVTFTGNVIGSDSVFMDGRAVMIMGDPKKITSCNLRPGDECETPWDVCCDDHDVIKASILTVQVVDGDGKPLKTGLKGLGGLKELSAVTVTGKVAANSNESNMLVNATGIYVQP